MQSNFDRDKMPEKIHSSLRHLTEVTVTCVNEKVNDVILLYCIKWMAITSCTELFNVTIL